MRAAVAAGAGLALLAAAAAPAAPVGAPTELRVSRPVDERPHPESRTEFWELIAVDPDSRRTLTVRLRRAPDLEGVDLFVAGGSAPAAAEPLEQRFERAAGPLVRFAGEGGTTTVDRSRGELRLTLEGPRVAGGVVLRRIRPGPLARGWRLGEALRFPSERYEPIGLNLNVPALTSVASGSIRVGELTVRIDGWRASFEHVWGSFDLYDDEWEHWDAYAVHHRRGAWLAFGLNRRDTATGPGARDAQWLGVLARVRGRRTALCRPRVHRRRWSYAVGEWPSSRELRARCRRLRVRLRDVPDRTLLRHESYVGLFEYADHATATGGGLGMGRHRGHPFP